MSLWGWVLTAVATAFALKLAGYLLPQSLLDRPSVTDLAGALTVGLLASLTTMNAVSAGSSLALDSRLLAVVVAAIALRLKAPFIVVVIVGALAAAAGRCLGLP